VTITLTDGAVRAEWIRFADALRVCWPAEVRAVDALPPPQWEGVLLTESSVLMPRLRQLPPELAEEQAASAVVRVSSHEAAARLLAQRVPLGILPGDAWFHWIFPEQGNRAELYGYRDIAESLTDVSHRPVTGLPEYGRFRSEERTLPELLADYLRAALG